MVKSTCVLIDPSLLDSHQQRKFKRVEAFADVIRKRGKVEYKVFLAEMQYYGLRKKVAEEYIDVLKDLGKIRFDNGHIIWNEQT